MNSAIKTLLVMAALCGLGREAQAKTIVVSADGVTTSIQQALRNAEPGDTVQVEAGTYRGNILLDRRITLEGIGNPTIQGEGRGSVITVTADGCTVRGFIVERSGTMLVDEDSGILIKSNGNRIEGNELRDVLFGIYLFNSSHNVLVGNSIQGRARLELGERGSGIHIWNSNDNVINDNTISETRDGMYLQNTSRSSIQRNRVSDLRYGLHYMFSDDNTFEDNVFQNNVAGAAIMYSKRIIFRRNAFLHNRGFSSFGILFQDTEACIAEDNIIADNVVGIFLEALRKSSFRRNLVAANDVAIQAFTSASENTFESNNFVANLSPMQVIGKRTTTQWSQAGVGNYWNEYDGYDLDLDGIGDVPFKIQNVFEHLEGNYPRLRLYLMSPASQALAMAEKAFPIIAGTQEFDPHPLMKPIKLSLPVAQLSEKPEFQTYLLVAPVGMLAVSVSLTLRFSPRHKRKFR
jgi:nitrous oxidase accessory protein